MAYTAAALITEAYYLSGMVSRDFQSVTGSQLNDGLGLLNQLLTQQAAGTRMISYYSRTNFTAVINQESYFISGLVFPEDVTFNFSSVRYTLNNKTRSQYFGTFRVNNISTLPVDYHIERERLGARIFVYPLPDKPYEFTITGKYALTKVEYDDDLELILDDFYIGYLEYALAQRICSLNGITFQPQSDEILKKYEKDIEDLSPIDFTCGKISTLQQGSSLNWGDVNIGKGWRR
jgi:hypothetical protein